MVEQAPLLFFWGAQAASLLVSAACRDVVRLTTLQATFHRQMLPASCRQLQAGSLRSPESTFAPLIVGRSRF
jgi:hypothetical protein